MTHSELQADLARTLRAQKRLVLPEVDLCSRWFNVPTVSWSEDDGAKITPRPGAPRVDVLRISESYTRFEVFVYEVKASRSDFLSDIRSAKWRQYLPYSHRLLFAVDSGVCTESEVPEECGLIVRRKSGKGWQTMRQPPRRDDIEWSAETFLAVLFSMRREPQEVRGMRWSDGEKAIRAHAKRLGDDHAMALSRARTLLAEIHKQTGDYCPTCGARVKPYLHELRTEERLRLLEEPCTATS